MGNLKTDLTRVDVFEWFQGGTVTITITLPVKLLFLIDDEARQTFSTRSRLATYIMSQGIKWEKIEQLREMETRKEEFERMGKAGKNTRGKRPKEASTPGET